MSHLLPPGAPAWRMSQPPLLPVSQAISLSRLICILGIVYVHGWTGLGGDMMAAQAGSPQDVLRWTFVELFGRSAVPLLSIISGWLVARSLTGRAPHQLLGGKIRTILVPMLLWNALAMLLVVGAGTLGLIQAPLPGHLGWFADNLLNLTRPGDINVQTGFLRDLFLCMLAAPLLVRMRDTGLFLIGLVALVWAIVGWPLYLLLRPSILLFFITGIFARRLDLAERYGTIAFWRACLPFALVAPVKVWMSVTGEGGAAFSPETIAAVDLAMRAAAAVLVWRSAMALARQPIAASLLGFERYAFFLFCSHLLFMWLIAPSIGALSGPMGSPAWPIFFLTQPLLALGFAMLLANGIQFLSPHTAALLSGGRLGRDQSTSPAARPLAQAH